MYWAILAKRCVPQSKNHSYTHNRTSIVGTSSCKLDNNVYPIIAMQSRISSNTNKTYNFDVTKFKIITALDNVASLAVEWIHRIFEQSNELVKARLATCIRKWSKGRKPASKRVSTPAAPTFFSPPPKLEHSPTAFLVIKYDSLMCLRNHPVGLIIHSTKS